MASIVHLTADRSTSNPSTTASVTVPNNGILILSIAAAFSVGTAVTFVPTLTGLTFVAASSVLSYATRRNKQVFYAVNTSGSDVTGTIGIQSTGFTGTFQEHEWSAELVSGGDTTTPKDPAVTGTTTTGTALNLPDVGTPGAGDVIFASFAFEDGANNFALASPLTELGSVTGGTNTRSLKTGYTTTDETPGATWTTSGNGCGGIAFIINSGSSTTPVEQDFSGSYALGGATQADFAGSYTIQSAVVIDDFNRADGGIGANYTNAQGTGLRIVGNELTGDQAEQRASLRTAESYGADQYVEFTIKASTAGNFIGGMLRTSGADGTRNGYMCDVGNDNDYYLSRYVNGAETNLAFSTEHPTPWAIGDVIRAQVVGYTLSLYRNGVLIASVDDPLALYASGQPGLYMYSAAVIDDAKFGTITSGGTTAVQQDFSSSYGIGGSTTADFAGTYTIEPSGSLVVTDDFTGTDANPIESPWVTAPNWNGFQRIGNAIAPSAPGAVMYRSGVTWPDDQYSKIRWTGTGTPNGGPASRINTTNGSCYFASAYSDGTTTIFLWTLAGGYQQLGQVNTGTWLANDVLEIRAVGSTISAWKNGTNVLEVTNTALTSGSAGVFDYPTADRYDDWEGGSISSTTAVISDYSGSYSIASSVQPDFAGSFGVSSAVQQDLAGAYGVSSSIQQDLAGSYSIASSVTEDLAGSYSVNGSVQSDGQGAFDIFGSVQQDHAGTYGVGGTIQVDLVGSFSTSETVQADLIGDYSLLGAVQADHAGSFSTSGVAQVDVEGSFVTLGSVIADFVSDYLIPTTAQADFSSSYGVSSSVQADTNGTYGIGGSVQTDLVGAYAIEAPGTVVVDFFGAYSTASPVQQDVQGSFGVSSSVQQDVSGSFITSSSVEVDLPGSYSTGGGVTADSSGSFSVLGSAQIDVSGTFGVAAPVLQDFGGSFGLQLEIQVDLAGSYGVVGAVIGDFIAAYGIGGVAQRDFSYAYLVLSTNDYDYVPSPNRTYYSRGQDRTFRSGGQDRVLRS